MEAERMLKEKNTSPILTNNCPQMSLIVLESKKDFIRSTTRFPHVFHTSHSWNPI
jgi:hypothetical protein